MYARLHDESVSVRSNTLTVLTHLILNDMIKVKGQISDMAWCIVDSEDKIAGLSKLFFAELSKKGNTLYNVMPDIVSRLSDPEKGVEEEPFRTIMKYIFGLIEKDKLLESLVIKMNYELNLEFQLFFSRLRNCVLDSEQHEQRDNGETFHFVSHYFHTVTDVSRNSQKTLPVGLINCTRTMFMKI